MVVTYIKSQQQPFNSQHRKSRPIWKVGGASSPAAGLLSRMSRYKPLRLHVISRYARLFSHFVPLRYPFPLRAVNVKAHATRPACGFTAHRGASRRGACLQHVSSVLARAAGQCALGGSSARVRCRGRVRRRSGARRSCRPRSAASPMRAVRRDRDGARH